MRRATPDVRGEVPPALAPRFERWLETAPLDDLLRAADRRLWVVPGSLYPHVYHRLDRARSDAVRARAAALILAGREPPRTYRFGGVDWVASAAGLYTRLPTD